MRALVRGVSPVREAPRVQKACFRSSARNHYRGQVVFLVTEGEVVRVWLQLDSGLTLQALLTRSSAEAMGLQAGMMIEALFKAASVQLVLDAALELQVSNEWWGEVIDVREGQQRDEVTLAVAPGLEVTALVDAGFCRRQSLRLGDAACAVFSASAVILVVMAWE